MRTIDIQEAKANVFNLIEQAARGQSFLIAISGTPRVMLIPLDSREATQLRRVGLLERCLVVAEEFDPRSEPEIEESFVSHVVAAEEEATVRSIPVNEARRRLSA